MSAMYKRSMYLIIALLLALGSSCEGSQEASADKLPAPAPIIKKPAARTSSESASIPVGMRLIQLELPRAAVGRLVEHDRVDIHGVLPVRRSNELIPSSDEVDGKPPSPDDVLGYVSMNVVQNVTVHASSCGESACNVGLYASVEEIALLTLAGSEGRMHLSRRSREDIETLPVRKMTLKEALQDLEVINIERKKRLEKKGVLGKNKPDVIDPRRRVCDAPQKTKPVELLPGERLSTFEFSGLNKAVVSISPGDRIDVNMIHPISQEYGVALSTRAPNSVFVNLLQMVRVEEVDGDRLTLVLTDDEIQMLLLAMARGELDIGLRNKEDLEFVPIFKRTLKSVLQDLEVVQMQRTARVRRKRKKKPSGIVITSGRGGSYTHQPRARAVPQLPPPRANANSVAETSTFGLDVDAGSYTLMREAMRRGYLPQMPTVRPEEFLNYFDWGLPQPPDGEDIGVTLEASTDPMSPVAEDHYLVRVGVKARDLAANERSPVHLTILVDTSGSMASEGRMDKVKKSLGALVSALGDEDTVALVTYAGDARVVLPHTKKRDRAALLTAIQGLEPQGSTAMEMGLKIAFQEANRGFKKGDVNRVLMLSDGIANVGQTEQEALTKLLDPQFEKGIALSTIGVGGEGYRDTTMEQLADNGDGNYYYIDSYDEIERVFLEQVDGTLQIMAKDAKIQVAFDMDRVHTHRLIGYENRGLKREDFDDDSVDAGEVGAGHEVTAIYALAMKPGASLDGALTVKMRYRSRGGEVEELERELGAKDFNPVESSSEAHRFAIGVAAFAEMLRHSDVGKTLHFAYFHELMTLASGASYIQQDARKQEFLSLYGDAWKMIGCDAPD